MMCEFKPGDEVVCVDDVPRGGGIFMRDRPVKGRRYTVLCIFVDPGGSICASLAEIKNNYFGHDGFAADRFRKVERHTDKRNLTEWLKQETSYDEEINNPAPNKRKKKGQEA